MTDNKISILYIIDRITGIYGSEKHLLELISGLDKTCFYPVIVTLSPDVAKEFYELLIPIYSFKINKLYSPMIIKPMFQIGKIIKKHQIDIIETMHSTSDMFGPLIGRLHRVKVIISNRRDMGFLRTRKHNLIYPWINRFVDKIKVVCNASIQYFSEIEKTDKRHYQLFYNGIHLENYAKPKLDIDAYKQKLGIRPGESVVGIVGNIKPIKGQMDLVDIAQELSKKNKSIKYLVVGGGMKNKKNEYLELMKSRLEERGLSNYFVFTGHRKDIPELIQVFDIALMLSRTEGCSNVLLEYMASGKAVIASDVGGNPELVTHRENGFLVSPGDFKSVAEKIDLLIHDSVLRRNMGIKSLTIASNHFNIQNAIANEANWYIDMVALAKRKR